jgi:hypothetical protein
MNFPNQTKHKIIIPAPFLGKMRGKNRFRQIVKIPPTPTTFILSGTFQGVTIHPDFRMIGREEPFRKGSFIGLIGRWLTRG